MKEKKKKVKKKNKKVKVNFVVMNYPFASS